MPLILACKYSSSELDQQLENLSHLPVLLVNGDMDNGIKAGFDSRFESMFPRCSSILIKGGAHFVIEEAPNQISDAIRLWWICIPIMKLARIIIDPFKGRT